MERQQWQIGERVMTPDRRPGWVVGVRAGFDPAQGSVLPEQVYVEDDMTGGIQGFKADELSAPKLWAAPPQHDFRVRVRRDVELSEVLSTLASHNRHWHAFARLWGGGGRWGRDAELAQQRLRQLQRVRPDDLERYAVELTPGTLFDRVT